MELRHLRYFEAVARTRNFTRASLDLGIAQPPLSRQIRALEQELGQDLFDRSERPIQLTEAGRIFYHGATQILDNVRQLKETMGRLGTASQRRITIGIVGSIMHGGLPETLRRFRYAASGTEVDLVELTTLEQVEALRGGRIDVGLGRVRIADEAIRREILQDEALVAAVPVTHLLAQRETLSLAELSSQALIIYPRSPRPSYADQVLDLLRDQGITPARTIEVREIQTALGLVAAEAGIAIVPHSMRQLRSGDVAFVMLEEPHATSPVILSERSNSEAPAADLFREIARDVFADRAAGEERSLTLSRASSRSVQ